MAHILLQEGIRHELNNNAWKQDTRTRRGTPGEYGVAGFGRPRLVHAMQAHTRQPRVKLAQMLRITVDRREVKINFGIAICSLSLHNFVQQMFVSLRNTKLDGRHHSLAQYRSALVGGCWADQAPHVFRGHGTCVIAGIPLFENVLV
jgi:hypothetical protein